MDRTRGNMRSPPPKQVRFDLTGPKSTPPLSSLANFGTTEAIKRMPLTRVYTQSKSLDTKLIFRCMSK